jgi:hypothetical protein
MGGSMIFRIGGWIFIIIAWPIMSNASEKKLESMMLIKKNEQKRPITIQGGYKGQVRELANFYIKLGLASIGCQPSKDKSKLIWEYLAIKEIIDEKYKKLIEHPSCLNIKDIYERLANCAAKTPEGARYATIRLKNKELTQDMQEGQVSAQDKNDMQKELEQKYKESYERWQKLSMDQQESRRNFYGNYEEAETAFNNEQWVVAHNKITEAFECALDTVFAQVERKSEDTVLKEISSVIIGYNTIYKLKTSNETAFNLKGSM